MCCARGLRSCVRPSSITPLCSKDCPIFYMRKKVQKDLNDQQKTVDRFGSGW